MASPDVNNLRDIFETDLTDPQLQLFIDDAEALVNDKLGGEGVGKDLLDRVKRYVAAHFASTRDPRTLTTTVGDASAKFEGRVRSFEFVGLQNTFYGQQALTLDPTGKLARLGRRQASVTVSLPDDFGEGNRPSDW